jgi:phosphoesterase RecJ-like protein
MNYPESQLILEEIKKAKKILLNCHRGPDSDTIGSALSMRRVLIQMGKDATVICPSDELPQSMSYLEGFSSIKYKVDFKKFNFSDYDLFLTMDSSSWDMVTGVKDFIPQIPTLVIDHHLTNIKYGKINLVDSTVTSTGELVFLVYEDWSIVLDKEMATCLMAGIVGDTGAFRYPGVNARSFKIVGNLMELGADKDQAIHALYRSEPFDQIKFYGEVLSRFEFDKENRFVWSAVPYEIFIKYNKPLTAKESAASSFAQVVEGTEFGFVGVESEKDKLSISLRSRNGFNTSQIAKELGGGGHIYASGAKIELPFEEAVEKVLAVCRKYANHKD